jgi:hypothetical protein
MYKKDYEDYIAQLNENNIIENQIEIQKAIWKEKVWY